MQIWGAAAGVRPGPSDLVWKSQKSWGTGDNIGVTLITDEGEVSERVHGFYCCNTEFVCAYFLRVLGGNLIVF